MEEIAIIGIGCRTAGADNIREFWHLLTHGECHVRDVPKDRWYAPAYLEKDDSQAHGKAYTQRAAFMKDIEGFDHDFYGISDIEASSMDPQQCMLLECTTMALENAGITKARVAGTNTGVYIGAMYADHGAKFCGLNSKMNNYTPTGTSTSILANRVSHVYDLRGPSLVIDTACSSSLIAIHMACQGIRSGDCDMAICGGVNVMILPDTFIQLSRAGMLSPSGLSQAFSDKADGYARGEGCGVIILKSVRAAEKQGDKLWATIFTGTNQSGRTENQMTRPSSQQQEKLLEMVYDRFRINPDDVDYIEAHGTGTEAGDPVEVNALGSFFQNKGCSRNRYIGSVKTNIGHTESAAGVLSIIKVLLMMKFDCIVPSLHCETVNPKIDLIGFNFTVPVTTIKWSDPYKTAACNCFGFGGSNCHAVLKSFTRNSVKNTEHVLSPVVTPEHYLHAFVSDNTSRTSATHSIVCFSGKTAKSLKESMQDLHADAEALSLDILDVAYTSTVCRDHYSHRTAFLVKDMQDLHVQLEKHDSSSLKATPKKPSVIFMFCGMVLQWNGIYNELMEQYKAFNDAILEVEKHLSSHVSWSLTERLKTEDPSKDDMLGPIAIFAGQVGLATLWQSLGIQPDCVIGQSIGEVTAAYIAGCLSLVDAVTIIYHRSRCLALPEITRGTMLLVRNSSLEKVEQSLQSLTGNATIAVENSNTSCIISVDNGNLSTLQSQLKAQNISYNTLQLKIPYHSHHVEPCLGDFERSIQNVSSLPPKHSFISTITGVEVNNSPDTQHWIKNLRERVLFGTAVKAAGRAAKSDKTVFLEIGPRPVLQDHLHDLFLPNEVKTVQSMSNKKEVVTFLQAATILYENGASIHFDMLCDRRPSTDIPRYMFDRKHIRENTEVGLILQNGVDPFGKNHLFVAPVKGNCDLFSLIISPLTSPTVYEHVISNTIIVPGAFFVETGFAVAQYLDMGHPVSISAEFLHPLSVKKNEVTAFAISMESYIGESSIARVLVQKDGHPVTRLKIRKKDIHSEDAVNVQHIYARCQQKMTKDDIYSTLHQLHFRYGKTFQLLEEARKSNSECIAEIRLHEAVKREMHLTCLHPNILDCMLQSSLIVVGEIEDSEIMIFPKSLENLSVYGSMQPIMTVHTRLKRLDSEGLTVDQRLLSCRGHIIAELSDLRIQYLKSTQQVSVPKFIHCEWQKVRDQALVPTPITAHGQCTTLVFSDLSTMQNQSNCQVIHYKDRLDSTDFHTEARQALTTCANLSGVCFVHSQCFTEETTGEKMQSDLVSMFCFIQTLLQILNDQSSSVPFSVCTLNAWTDYPPNDANFKVNPVATALWGLFRTILIERIYPNISAVELHVPFGELTSDKLLSCVQLLRADADLKDCPEILMTSEAVYGNQVLEIHDSFVPELRKQKSRAVSDIPSNSVFLCREMTTLSDVTAIFQESTLSPFKINTENVRLCTFVQPSTDLLMLIAASDILDRAQSTATLGHVLMALEFTGQSQNRSEEDVIICCPSVVGPVLTVPSETILPADSMPNYQPGDLSKLVLLRQFLDNINTERVTILASASTEHLALCLTTMCPTATTTTVMLEQPSDISYSIEETLISLILLDFGVMSSIKAHWKHAKTLIACSSLVTAKVRSMLSCTMPEIELCLLDTQLIYQSCNLVKSIPKLKAWIKSNHYVFSATLKALHSTPHISTESGMGHLFKFKCTRLRDLSVEFQPGKLFRKDSCYIVVGGLSGLGWMCVKFLAENDAGFIATINRRVPSKDQVSDMANMSRVNNCEIQSFQGDITSTESLSVALQNILQTSRQQIRGIFIGAAELEAALFSILTRSDVQKVLSPKVLGSWNLHKLTKNFPLDYFVLHSSVASVFGNLGQANYSCANAFQDGLAFYRCQSGLVAQTINWGPLDTGMLEHMESARKQLLSQGFSIAEEKEIHDTLRIGLLRNWTQTVPVTIDYDKYNKQFCGSQSASAIWRFRKLLSPSEPKQTMMSSNRETNVEYIRHLAVGDRLHAYEEYLKKLTGRMIGHDYTQLTQDSNFHELGVDSVRGAMMISQIHRDTSCKVDPVNIFTADATIASLAVAIDKCAEDQK